METAVIWIMDSRLKPLLTSAIEVYNRETDGVFSGKFVLREIMGRKRTVLYVENAYPFQTAERKPSEVYHGNIAAFERVMQSLTSADIEFVGGYHSHPAPYKLARPSKSDIEFIKEELDFIRKSKELRTQSEWLEILICIKRRGYARKQKTGWRSRRHGKKMRFSLTITPYTRYEILMSAYWIGFSGKKHVVSESKVHIESG